MKIALIIVSALILLFFRLLLIPTYCEFEFKKSGAEKKSEVKIKYLFFTFKPKEKPQKEKTKKEKPKEKTKKKSIGEWFSLFKLIEDDIIEILQYAKKHAVSVKYLKFIMDFGMADAMQTGIATGAAYGTVYNVLGFLNRNIPVEECDIKINPDFDRAHLETDIKCIFRIKNVHIIVIAVKALKMYFKMRKNNTQKERKL